jgi:sulfur-carrier protein
MLSGHEDGLEDRSSGSITVVLPHQIREQVGGRRSLTVAPGTVRQILQALDELCPGLIFRICYETGEIRPFVNVFVASENIKYLHGLDTLVANGATVHIIHSVAGGACGHEL